MSTLNFLNPDNANIGRLLLELLRCGNETLNAARSGAFQNVGCNSSLCDQTTLGDQKGQVSFLVNNVFDYQTRGLPTDGYFVDLACADGVAISNTYFLEKHLGWKGLLFEPNPEFHQSIQRNRSSELIGKCVADQVGRAVDFRTDNGMLGGIVSDGTDNSPTVRGLEGARVTQMTTTTLEHELREHNAPPLIDFLSLDIEGAEYRVLKNFPFSQYTFRCMCIERPSPSLDVLLDKNGYVQVAHLSFDVMYVHRDFIADVNMNPVLIFKCTPRKTF